MYVSIVAINTAIQLRHMPFLLAVFVVFAKNKLKLQTNKAMVTQKNRVKNPDSILDP